MSDRFHRAARDGLLDVLKEATRRDCNAHDEDGMTPTIWAAYEGRLDALRLLVGRGGDPDKCDHYGNTALHCSAARGHMSCATFLVNFGVNLWSLDNDFHTPKELAALNNKDEILRFLDNAAADQERTSPKDVKQKKEKATKEAEKRIKDFSKLQKKATKRAEKEEKKMQKDRERMRIEESSSSTNGGGGGGGTSSSSDHQQQQHQQQESKPGLSTKLMSTISRNSFPGLVHAKDKHKEGMKYSDMVSTGSSNSSGVAGVFSKRHVIGGGGVKGKIQQKREATGISDFKVREMERDGNKTVRSLTGLRRDSEVMYVPKFDTASTDGNEEGGLKMRGRIPEFGAKTGPMMDLPDGDVILHEPSSLFDRPGFGSVAFRTSISATLNNLRSGGTLEEEEEEFTPNYSGRGLKVPSRGGDETSIGSAGSIARSQEAEVPWDVEDLPSDEEGDATPLQILLASTNLLDWLPVFNKEQIDLEALMLLSESDMAKLGLPLGPRKKLMKALQDRKNAIENPGDVIDSKI